MPSLPVLDQGGAPGATSARCAACSAPLADDQLFCLACGARRRDARIAFRDVLATEAAPVFTPMGSGPGGPAVPGATGGLPQQGAPLGGGPVTLLAMALCLLLALGLGVWIGRGQDAPVATAAPVAAPLTAVAATTPAVAVAAEDEAAQDDAATEEEAAADDAEAAADEPAAAAPEPPAAAKALENLAPEDYQKQAQKLPAEVGTGGAAPPKDDKPAGAGSEFEDFE